eukprot:115029_1
MANIECAPNTVWKEIRLICSKDACTYSTVNITDATVDTLSVLCDGSFACDGLQLTVNAASHIDVYMECNELFSCKDMLVHLMHDTRTNKDDAVNINMRVSCYADNSCDDMLITTDHSRNIYIQLNAMRYSEHILILYRFWRNIKVNCGFDG